MTRTSYEANVCVLLRRDDRWLLSRRSARAAYAPGQIGLIGGHVEPVVGTGVLEATGRREVAEETGLDLTTVPLHYLDSALYLGADGQPVLTVTYAGELPPGPEPVLGDPVELAAVGWWSRAELASAGRDRPEQVGAWLLPLVAEAERLLDRAARS